MVDLKYEGVALHVNMNMFRSLARKCWTRTEKMTNVFLVHRKATIKITSLVQVHEWFMSSSYHVRLQVTADIYLKLCSQGRI